MAEYVSTLTYTDEQKSATPNLEPSLEHLLRSSSVHESIITTLRVNEITDRDTFVNLFDSETTLNMSAADLGANLSGSDLRRKRKFSRLVTAWKTATVMSETKLQTDAVARAHGVPVTFTSSQLDCNDDGVQEIARDSHPRRSAASPNVLRTLRGEVGRWNAQSGASFN